MDYATGLQHYGYRARGLERTYLLVGVNVDVVHHKGMVEVRLGLLLGSKALAAPAGDSFNERRNDRVPDRV